MHEHNPDNLPACMGGFCDRRESCAQHHAQDRDEPAERLCAKGERNAYIPLRSAEFLAAMEAF